MGFAVHKCTGIRSFSQIVAERFPLRLSTNVTSREMIAASPTMFTVSAVMKAAGFTLSDLKKWGGQVISVPRPSHPDRRKAIQSGTVNAVFDEGIKSWGQTAIDNGFTYLPIEGQILRRLAALGYQTSVVPKSRFKGMFNDVPTVDFSGWPMVVHADPWYRNYSTLSSPRTVEGNHAVLVRMVTNSSAAVGWMPIVASNWALVAPQLSATARPWMTSPASGPTI